MQNGPRPRPARFVPRATLTLLAAVALFFAVTFLYSLPALLEEPPPGAIPDWHAERVKARLAGKVHWIFGGCVLVVAAVAQRRRPR